MVRERIANPSVSVIVRCPDSSSGGAAITLLSKFTVVWFGLLLSSISVKVLGGHERCSTDIGSRHEMRLVPIYGGIVYQLKYLPSKQKKWGRHPLPPP